jgi:hypothetical protein
MEIKPSRDNTEPTSDPTIQEDRQRIAKKIRELQESRVGDQARRDLIGRLALRKKTG